MGRPVKERPFSRVDGSGDGRPYRFPAGPAVLVPSSAGGAVPGSPPPRRPPASNDHLGKVGVLSLASASGLGVSDPERRELLMAQV